MLLAWLLSAATAEAGDARRRGHRVAAVGLSMVAAGLGASGGLTWLGRDDARGTSARVGAVLLSAGAPILAHGTLLTRHHHPQRDDISALAGGLGVALGSGAVLVTAGGASTGWDPPTLRVGAGVALTSVALSGLQAHRHALSRRRPAPGAGDTAS